MTRDAHDWVFTHDLDEFLTSAGDFLRSRPALHTVALSVTNALRRRGPGVYGQEAPFFGRLADGDGDGDGGESGVGGVSAVLFHTPPYQLNLTDLPAEAVDALAERLADEGYSFPGIGGPVDTAAEFAAAWERRVGAHAQLRRSERLYRLGTLTPPTPVPPGRARVAGEDDHALVARWYSEFAEIFGQNERQDPEGWTESRLAYGGVTLWETPDGTPVAMAGVTPLIAGQIRVAPVYTPAPLRGRGYAGAATAEVSRAALAAGADEVLLFTDLANPTSNGLYQRIGYRPVADFAVYDFLSPHTG
ncbi:GNAT family N-acetyltransferase [Streptomyces sp. NBC_01136]|uniref:GNAT family N-acetyltransferase n=1 Tax=unclassified Streptomyces TaxID=2593676 RepID=UPI003244476C|nr:GNAT family N-acetyltransferase [Streptomyces sp. NBC_01136]